MVGNEGGDAHQVMGMERADLKESNLLVSGVGPRGYDVVVLNLFARYVIHDPYSRKRLTSRHVVNQTLLVNGLVADGKRGLVKRWKRLVGLKLNYDLQYRPIVMYASLLGLLSMADW